MNTPETFDVSDLTNDNIVSIHIIALDTRTLIHQISD
jgi:hypothetical protein